MSSLRGTAGSRHLGDEVVEEADGVVRPRPRLRVVLDAAGRDPEPPDTPRRAVVGGGVRGPGPPEVRLQAVPRLAAHGEPVVLRGDRDPARADVLDRVVG